MDHQRIWLWSEGIAAKFCLPIEAIEAYLPGVVSSHPDFLAATASSQPVMIFLDGVSGELLGKIDEYLRHFFPEASATDASASDDHDGEVARLEWIKDFVHKLDARMVEMMLDEVAKRNPTAVEMVLLHDVLHNQAFINMRSAKLNSEWKLRVAKNTVQK